MTESSPEGLINFFMSVYGSLYEMYVIDVRYNFDVYFIFYVEKHQSVQVTCCRDNGTAAMWKVNTKKDETATASGISITKKKRKFNRSLNVS